MFSEVASIDSFSMNLTIHLTLPPTTANGLPKPIMAQESRMRRLREEKRGGGWQWEEMKRKRWIVLYFVSNLTIN
jgi:hypothetical protein